MSSVLLPAKTDSHTLSTVPLRHFDFHLVCQLAHHVLEFSACIYYVCICSMIPSLFLRSFIFHVYDPLFFLPQPNPMLGQPLAHRSAYLYFAV